MDATAYGIRAALVGNGTQLQDNLEARPGQISTVLRFVKRCYDNFPDLKIVGAPADRWPPELRNSAVSTTWLDWKCSRQLDWEWAIWQKRRRLLRARLIAYAADRPPIFDPLETILDWEEHVANETLREIDALRSERATHHL
jgi:hypothetical protein